MGFIASNAQPYQPALVTGLPELDGEGESSQTPRAPIALVYGPRKSGTTLMLNLLDGAPDLAVHPEELKLSKLFGTFWRVDNASATFADIAHHNYDFAGENAAAYKDALQGADFDSLREAIERDLQVFSELVHKSPRPTKLFVVKEVGGTSRHIVTLFRHLFVDGKVVSVMRRPEMVVRAIVMDRRRKGIRISAKGLVVETVDAMLNLRDQVALAAGSGICSLKYEELVSDVERNMRRLASFLGVLYSEVMTRPTVLGRDAVVRTSSRDTNKVFRSDRSWYQDLTPREIFFVFGTAIAFRAYSKLRGRPIPRYEKIPSSSFSP